MEDFDELVDAFALIENTIIDDPPHPITRDGGVFKNGVDDDLDELRSLSSNARGKLADFESEQRELTGIKNLKVGFNKVFGYIEISKGNIGLAPENYERKQTLVNAERYITQGVKRSRDKILNLEKKMIAIENKLYDKLKHSMLEFVPRIRKMALQNCKVLTYWLLLHRWQTNIIMSDQCLLKTLSLR